MFKKLRKCQFANKTILDTSSVSLHSVANAKTHMSRPIRRRYKFFILNNQAISVNINAI